MLALSNKASGTGVLQPLQGSMSNQAGAAVVNAIGPIRQLVRGEDKAQPRYRVIAPGTAGNSGAPVPSAGRTIAVTPEIRMGTSCRDG